MDVTARTVSPIKEIASASCADGLLSETRLAMEHRDVPQRTRAQYCPRRRRVPPTPLGPACENGEVIGFENSRCWLSRVGFRPVRGRTDRHGSGGRRHRNSGSRSRRASGRRRCAWSRDSADGQKHALGARLERDLASPPGGVLPQRDHR